MKRKFTPENQYLSTRYSKHEALNLPTPSLQSFLWTDSIVGSNNEQ